jgi:transposase
LRFNVEHKRWVRTDGYDTGFVDLAGDRGLLGQVEGGTSACVIEWLEARTPEFRAVIRYVAIDPAAVYAKPIRAHDDAGELLLPDATLVVDHFHLVKLANDAVTKVRRRVIWEQKGRRGRKIDPAWANRRRLLTAKEHLSHQAFAAMWNSLIDSHPSAHILTAWIAKEELRALLALARTGATATRSASGCSRSTPGAPTPASKNCTPSPPRSRPGGRRSRRSSAPASPTRAPRASTD